MIMDNKGSDEQSRDALEKKADMMKAVGGPRNLVGMRGCEAKTVAQRREGSVGKASADFGYEVRIT